MANRIGMATTIGTTKIKNSNANVLFFIIISCFEYVNKDTAFQVLVSIVD